MIHSRRKLFLRMRDEKSDEPHHFLHCAVRVIEECSFLVNRKLVRKFPPGRGGFLADPWNTVLLDGHFESVPMHRSALGQSVFKNNSDAIPLLHLNRRSRAASVVAPHVEGLPRHNRALHRFGDEMEHLYFTVSFKWQIANVRRAHRYRRPASGCSAAFFLLRFSTNCQRGRLCAQAFCPAEKSRSHQRRISKETSA